MPPLVRGLVGAIVAALLLFAACTPGPHTSAAVRESVPQPSASSVLQVVYAALGASETVGMGAQDPRRQSWPTVLYQTSLPSSAVYYNLGIPGATTRMALASELPAALSVQPTLVTVWLNVDDLAAGVSPAEYETRLGQLVHAARRGGLTRVLVANTPYLDRLPVYLACRQGGQRCPFAGGAPPPAALEAEVDAYNVAIARVVEREGATIVDLHAAGEVPDAHPDWIAADGFHPSAAGYAAIAATFAVALGWG